MVYCHFVDEEQKADETPAEAKEDGKEESEGTAKFRAQKKLSTSSSAISHFLSAIKHFFHTYAIEKSQ